MAYWFNYILKSTKDNNMYIGCTNNLKARLVKHNSGFVTSTKHRRPLELIYFEACLNKTDAFKREIYLKSGYGHRWLKQRLKNAGSQTTLRSENV